MKNKKLVLIVILIVVAALAGGMVALRNAGAAKLVKTANTSHPNDVRYVSFGGDYVFATPSSFVVDESSIAGVQLLVPANGANLQVSNYDQLFDATVVAVQRLSQVKANDNKEFKKYIDETLVPDLKKNISSDVTVTYKMVGKYQSATIIAKKDGQQVREMYAYGGSHPYIVTAKEKTDVSTEVITTLIGVSNATNKDDITAIKEAIQTSMGRLQGGKIQELYDNGSAEFKQKTTFNDLNSAINTSASFVHRNIVIPGGSINTDKFSGALVFTSPTQGEAPSIGTINFQKEGNQWKLSGLTLPTPPAPAPTPTPKKK